MALKLFRRLNFGVILLTLVFGAGCNRATMRIPGASSSFPDTATGYKARKQLRYRLVVALPTDHRKEYYGQRIAGTQWTSSANDAFWTTDAGELVQKRLVQELSASGLFAEVTTRPPAPGDLVLKTELDAFSAQARGFLVVRIVGMSSIRETLECDGRTFLDHQFEQVVTDADPEYTGSQFTFIEQAMQTTMADSLRELMKKMLKEIEASGSALANPS